MVSGYNERVHAPPGQVPQEMVKQTDRFLGRNRLVINISAEQDGIRLLQIHHHEYLL